MILTGSQGQLMTINYFIERSFLSQPKDVSKQSAEKSWVKKLSANSRRFFLRNKSASSLKWMHLWHKNFFMFSLFAVADSLARWMSLKVNIFPWQLMRHHDDDDTLLPGSQSKNSCWVSQMQSLLRCSRNWFQKAVKLTFSARIKLNNLLIKKIIIWKRTRKTTQWSSS